MALRAIPLVFPSVATAFKTANVVQKASVHMTAVRKLKYGWWAYALGERTTPHLKQSSKIISVDGNLASGKGALAQKLADKLGMLYMPEPDTFYLDKMSGEKEPLPVDFNGMCSLEKFYMDPKAADGNSYRLQLWMYIMRLLQYSDAIEHLLTTGQGVIMERSPFSDMVFLDAMFKQGYIRKECVQHYNEIKDISICEFLPPHLVVYVDVPADEVQKKLTQSGKSYLQNVPLPYLKSIEDSYKKSFLPQISEKSELLAYDATQAQDVEKVVEDIEYLKFEKGPWLEQDDVTYHHMRMLVEDKQRVASLTHIPRFLPEITIGAHDFDEKYYAFKSLPGKKYARGYNTDVGDKYIWLK
ncbi:NADH dehydrogenase [ubiquinone] 1 alpha subcomplex subunit 10, mitochondrial isoform X1 [Phyllopteryx taeniolatus]|uniref:NADH dehydrogenase [ubiquinone] 1 alpha subcomplex subunit 10, mitochondrial isoform X1 n=2 Tax=Phyllopteryx taeniolatus TaxID=161469 RepID=UPI002AD3BE5C|nr:NADH dehydrogenase [ubiquinone] 1 alpha subcomplex subunit 10, mitochondrial isoform X1 [Phyllopteryx taeniolatus]